MALSKKQQWLEEYKADRISHFWETKGEPPEPYQIKEFAREGEAMYEREHGSGNKGGEMSEEYVKLLKKIEKTRNKQNKSVKKTSNKKKTSKKSSNKKTEKTHNIFNQPTPIRPIAFLPGDNQKKATDEEMKSFDEKLKKNKKKHWWTGKGSAISKKAKEQVDMDAAADRIERAGGAAKNIAWTNPKKKDARRKHYAQPSDGISGTVRRGSRKIGSLGYALPSPIAVFTLAWQSMSKAMKFLIVLVFAVVIFFVPWGVFYYSGWAVGAGFMFLVSVIYWAFISFFNAIASIVVTLINATATIIMYGLINAVEIVTSFMRVPRWTAGRELVEKSLIQFDQLAEVPSLMTVIEPEWQSWMNNALITHLLFNVFKVDYPLTWLSKPVSDFYASLDAGQAMMVGLMIIAIPIGLIAFAYFKNRHHFH